MTLGLAIVGALTLISLVLTYTGRGQRRADISATRTATEVAFGELVSPEARTAAVDYLLKKGSK